MKLSEKIQSIIQNSVKINLDTTFREINLQGIDLATIRIMTLYSELTGITDIELEEEK